MARITRRPNAVGESGSVSKAALLESRWLGICQRLEDKRLLLARQGSVVAKQRRGRTTWSLRFVERLPSGRTVQHSWSLGAHPELAERVRLLLEEFRQPQRLVRETAELVRLATGLTRVLRVRLRRLRPAVGPGVRNPARCKANGGPVPE
jgi:hypothetical protein